ncbi:MAG: FadR family transcriptional regulator [Streptosporangiales bacterium]|jgi:DNA-binding FadR family transcriptional regulator|nr:FadR family transcriptional regulator [Streptosporangiales bacterium]
MAASGAKAGGGKGTDSPVAGPELFSKVSVGRMSEVIVEKIRELMREGQLKPGDRLPPERELCERFGVSRVTMREALRMLESAGLVDIRVGARGGAFVTAPTSNRVGEGLADLLTLSVISASNVTEVRMILEVGIVPLVCERATEDDLARLEKICERAEEALRAGDYTMDMSLEFHTAVAQATHNPALEMLVESFRGPILMSLEEAREVAPEMGGRGTEEHEQFIEAVRRRDADAAARVMRQHLTRTARRVQH